MNGLRILVVDDDRDFAETIADVLESRAHTVDIAGSGEEALQFASLHPFDLAFMDVRLPGMDGVASFLELRKKNPHAKVIMMTGFSMEQLLDEALKNGAWAVLKKPLDIPEILSMVDRIRPDGTVLIVDDDPDFLRSVSEILELSGYSVVTAANGREAIERVGGDRIDLILLDIRLPDIDGLEIFSRVRSQSSNLPVIIVTGYPEDEAGKVSAINSSKNTGVMVKPIDPTILRRTVDELISRTDLGEPYLD
ncbi:MAG: response regulator [Candidatus Omnitrophica bacterium]|nr:response regulator [Candidatus Omnitrophota bacterium]